jgi:hypothetical protein
MPASSDPNLYLGEPRGPLWEERCRLVWLLLRNGSAGGLRSFDRLHPEVKQRIRIDQAARRREDAAAERRGGG